MRTLLLLLISLCCATAYAQSKVVVIPLGGDDFEPLQNVITVALDHGHFKSLEEAVNSIPFLGPQRPSLLNPYLIVIGPGVYEITRPIEIPSHVSVTGSGRLVTELQIDILQFGMAVGSSLSLSSSSSLSDLTINNVVESNFGDAFGAAVETRGVDVYLERLDISSSIAGNNTGIKTFNGTIRIEDVNVSLKNGTQAIGIDLSAVTSSRLNNLSVDVSSTHSGQVLGIRLRDSAATIMNSIVEVATSVGSSAGVLVDDSSPLIIGSEIVSLAGGNPSLGIKFETEQFAPRVLNSIVRGATAALDFSGAANKATVVGSSITGGVINDPPINQCRDNYNAVLATVDC